MLIIQFIGVQTKSNTFNSVATFIFITMLIQTEQTMLAIKAIIQTRNIKTTKIHT